MKTFHLSALLFTTLGLAACGKTPEPGSTTVAAEPSSVSATPAAPAITPVDTLVKNVVADGVLFQPEAAKVDGDALVSTGEAGFLMYGPYVPFVPGVYHVTVHGSIPSLDAGSQVTFDAASGTGAVVHGAHAVNTVIPEAGKIAEFDITIPEGVVDLELRANVTKGAVVRVESYEVVKAN